MKDALFGPTIAEITKQCKIGFDTHFKTINIVYFDEHNTPLEASPDRTPDFIHALEQWFKHITQINKTPTIKIEKANGQGFVIALIPISQHKIEKGWFQAYVETNQWKNSKGEYWKNGFKFDCVADERIIVTKYDPSAANPIEINLAAPKDELQVNVMLELLK